MTPLLGFTQGLVRLDSLRCYTPFELRAISNKLIDGAECDTLLKVANRTIVAQDTVIKSQAKTIVKEDLRYKTTEHLVNLCTTEKEVLKKDVKKLKNRLIWTKVGWAFTSVILTITTVLALIK